ncbi:MAG: hypothetical protein AMXMBFR47_34840 [Planctomycetota bacterium]
MNQSVLDRFDAASLAFVEEMFQQFQRDPALLSADWRQYFEGMLNGSAGRSVQIGPSFRPSSIFNPPHTNGSNGSAATAATKPHSGDASAIQHRVDGLIRNYRMSGHRMAAVNPLSPPSQTLPPDLDPKTYGFSEADFDRIVSTELIAGPNRRTLREILAVMFNTYCRSIGVQYMHIDDLRMREWLQQRMESTENHIRLTRQEQLRILMKLTDAYIFEQFLRKKYGQKKSFSLMGGESLIPLLDMAIEKAGAQGVEQVVLAMAHRGRLNVLANILDKRPFEIFAEFEDKFGEAQMGRGDVKYHLGHNAERKIGDRSMHLSLCFNPSHLEYVNPVAMGRTRAKQDRFFPEDRRRGLCIMIHGDAAFAGEGVTQETLNLSRLPGYAVGGTLHIIVNNQIGFTTGADQARSSLYSSSVARMMDIPIFHVNGEDPEAVAQVIQLAMEFRQEFQQDAVVEMWCYRTLGHNEADEPRYTQPKMYRDIDERKSVREGYLDHLLKLGGVTREEADVMVRVRREHLERDLARAQTENTNPPYVAPGKVWEDYSGGLESSVPDLDTGVPIDRLKELLAAQLRFPDGFQVHPKLERLFLADRGRMAAGEIGLDWSACESLAFATAATEGVRVRMTGQDVERGTFSHRHAVFHDHQTDGKYCPLQHLAPNQATIEIVNSPLSEIGVMGFEYGYSLDSPDALVLWEAQFGDFANVSQVIIDQFIASAEEKWNRLSGLVLLLPHGMEGMGPEHSSARLERFLALCASDNLQVIYPSTPGQYFHALRRQAIRRWRKPLIVMTPKSLLRDRITHFEDIGPGTRFQRVIGDTMPIKGRKISRVLLCAGKIYFELEAKRREARRDDVAIVRIEQLYPWPVEALRNALADVPDGVPAIWVQEEPLNMGAWRSLFTYFGANLLDRHPFSVVCRPPAASPATGSGASHELEQAEVISEAFGSAPRRPRQRT